MAEQCQCCNRPRRASAPISVVIVWAVSQPRGYPLFSDEDYTICLNPGCESAALFVSRAATSHQLMKQAGPWTAAVIVFADRLVLKLELGGPPPASA